LPGFVCRFILHKFYLVIGLIPSPPKKKIIYRCAPVSTDPRSTVSVIRVSPLPEKINIGKLKKETFRKFQNARQTRTAVISLNPASQTRPVLDLSSFFPYSRFPAECSSILHQAFSLFALAAALSQCLCSESPYLSIKFHILLTVYHYV
jgi:hypothetical protein